MRIDYKQLERDIPKIAAYVEAVSELRVPLDTLSFEVADLFTRSNDGAQYLPSERKIKFYRNNIPPLHSQNSANLFLSHELMHHAQFSIENFKQIAEKAEKDPSNQILLRSFHRIMEGDATWVECELEKFYSLDVLSRISDFRRKIILEYAGAVYGMSDSADRYALGKRRIDALVATGGRAAVNRLYASNPLEIADNFSDSMIEKSITSGEKHFKANFGNLAYKIDRSACRSERALDEAIENLRITELIEKIAELKRSYDEAIARKKK